MTVRNVLPILRRSPIVSLSLAATLCNACIAPAVRAQGLPTGTTRRELASATIPTGEWFSSDPVCIRFDAAAYRVAFRPMGLSSDPDATAHRRIAIALKDGRSAVWDPQSGQIDRLGRTPDYARSVLGVAYTPEGDLITALLDGSVQMWEAGADGDPRSVRMKRSGNGAFAVAASRPWRATTYIATGNQDGTIDLFALSATGDATFRIPTTWRHSGPVFQLDFSPDGRFLASAGQDGKVLLWDLAHPDANGPVRKMAHPGMVFGVAFSPDRERRLIATAASDGGVRVWDYSDAVTDPDSGDVNRDEASASSPVALLRPEGGTVAPAGAVAFASNGLLAAGYQDGRVALYRLPTTVVGQQAQVVPLGFLKDAHNRPLAGVRVTGLSFDREGQHLAASAYDGTIRCWNFEMASFTPEASAGSGSRATRLARPHHRPLSWKPASREERGDGSFVDSLIRDALTNERARYNACVNAHSPASARGTAVPPCASTSRLRGGEGDVILGERNETSM